MIGRIVGAHGIKGEVKVFPMTSWPERFLGLSRCFIESADGVLREWKVEKARLQGRKFILMKLGGLDDRSRAERMKGCTVNVPMSERMPLDEGQYYQDDLIGCEVRDGDGAVLGTVEDFSEQGGGGLLVVRMASGLVDVPFVDVYVESIRIEEGAIVLTSAWRALVEAEEV